MQNFYDIIGNQIFEGAVEERNKFDLVEATHGKSFTSAKSVFLDIKHGDQIVKTTRGVKDEAVGGQCEGQEHREKGT